MTLFFEFEISSVVNRQNKSKKFHVRFLRRGRPLGPVHLRLRLGHHPPRQLRNRAGRGARQTSANLLGGDCGGNHRQHPRRHHLLLAGAVDTPQGRHPPTPSQKHTSEPHPPPHPQSPPLLQKTTHH